MARPPVPPRDALGAALRDRRDGRDGRTIAAEIGITQSTLSNVERGTHKPSAETALRLARWLGWSVERVLEAAKEPAEAADACDSEA